MAQNFRKADCLRKFFNGCEITMETFERELCVRGYHVYQRIWMAAVGEVLHCEREPTNSRNRYAVAVKKDEIAIGHLPRKVSRVCSLQRSLEKEWTATVILSDQEARPWGRGTSVEPWLYLRTRVKCA